MKIAYFIAISLLVGTTFFISCDKVDNPYLPQYIDIDTTLLDGIDIVTYKNTLWPTFSQNTNSNRNVLIEDYTGHKCVNCPPAAVELHSIKQNNPGRVFGVGIHMGPKGNTSFQNTSGSIFSTDFTTTEGVEISMTISDGGFIGNPSGTVNRKTFNNQIFQSYTNWASYTSTILNENQLNVNLQSKINYFPSTRGVFLHTEIELLNNLKEELYQVVYLVEDSIISPQSTPSNWSFPNNTDLNYVHKDVHRGCIDGKGMGRQLKDENKVDKDGNTIDGDKYYLNYSYKLPIEYNAENMHLLIYVYNKTTKEIYQVIRQAIIE